ncbi:MAG: hypothetical protein AB1305_05305 [Candidatus Hadarchaeota archaeon]
MEVEKGRPTKLFEGAEEAEWQTLNMEKAFQVAESLADPIRQWIYLEIGKGPLRQAELAKRASGFFKRNITNVLIRYHLQQLEEADLLRFEFDPVNPKRLKLVHRASDMRVQVRNPTSPPGQDLRKELEKIFKGRKPQE